MTPALLIVLIILVLLVTFVIVVVRSLRRMEQASGAYLRELATRLGVTVEREYPARLTGERNGRRFIVSMKRSTGQRSQTVQTWIEIPVATEMDLQVQPQTSDLGAQIARDQELGHTDFDAACFLRTTDIDAVRLALDDGMRALIAEECGSRDLRLLVVHRQWLRIELRGAPDDPGQEAQIVRFLDLGLTLAGRLDASSTAGRATEHPSGTAMTSASSQAAPGGPR
jgi:hypothetical protein